MTSDRHGQRKPLLLLGLPHPVTSALAAYVQDVAAACDPPVDCELVTEERAILPSDTALHLRPEATETHALVTTLVDGAGADSFVACIVAARLDACWKDVLRLPVERVLASPDCAVDAIAACLDLPATARMHAVARRGVASLRAGTAAFDHPLTFWFAGPVACLGAIASEPDAASPGGIAVTGSAPAPSDAPGGYERSPAAAGRAAAHAAETDARLTDRIFVLADDGWAVLPGRKL